MRRLFIAFATLFLSVLCDTFAQNPVIIPAPKKVTATAGTLTKWDMKRVKVRKDKTLPSEAYVLDISPRGITIKASTKRGELYARQSLLQLAEQGHELPCMTIEDEPTFGYRGFMLDVSRHFFSVDEIKRILDVMARYKMNVFHWHLTDDQGWRAEVKRYPKLTDVGARRSNNYETYIHKVEENGWTYWTGTGANTDQPYGPYFYTQDEMRDVVRYAAERGIDVLPEVDMPGHFVAALAAYPEFRCPEQREPQVWSSWGVSVNVLNVANPKAVEFAKNIIDELCDIFPYPYFHIGGDECPTAAWEASQECQALMQATGLASYRQLQSRFIQEISLFLQSKGRMLYCWNESVTAKGADLDIMQGTGATIMSWMPCEAGMRKAISLGLPTICTEYNRGKQSYYINRRQCSDFGEPTGAGDGDDSVEECYNLIPMPAGLSADEQALVRGVQATFWTEHVGTDEYLEYLALPRLVCVAEAGWSRQDQKEWPDFRARLQKHLKWFDDNRYVYSTHWMPGYKARTATP